MRFPTRRAPAATYAAIVDDRVLWVALAEPAAVTLVPTSGGTTVGPAGVDDTQTGHHGVRFDLTSLPGGPGAWELRVHPGRALLGPPVRPVAAGAEFALTRDDAAALHVVRRPLAAGATLRGVRLIADSVQLTLDRTGAEGELHLLDAESLVASLPISNGTVTIDSASLRGLGPGERTLRLLVGGLPVRRRAGDLADPGSGVPLPAVHPAGSPTPRARLRWSPEGTLALRLIERHP